MKKNSFKKYFVIGIIILFLGASVIPSVISNELRNSVVESSMNETLHVDDDGNDYHEPDFYKIQDAIDDAHDGDTIMVYAGYYPEHIVIDKELELYGGNNGTSTIDGRVIGDVVIISAEHVRIENFTIINSGYNFSGNWNYDAGIRINSSHNNIFNNNVSFNAQGIFVKGATEDNTISNNFLTNNFKEGISLFPNSHNNNIYSNIIRNSTEDSIVIWTSSDNEVSNNIIINCSIGIFIVTNSKNNMISENCISSAFINPDYPYPEITGCGIVFDAQCSRNHIFRNIIKNNERYGVFLRNWCNWNDIFLNDFINNGQKSATFQHCLKNNWQYNYYSDHNPNLFFHTIWGFLFIFPWPNFDLTKSQTPNNDFFCP